MFILLHFFRQSFNQLLQGVRLGQQYLRLLFVFNVADEMASVIVGKRSAGARRYLFLNFVGERIVPGTDLLQIEPCACAPYNQHQCLNETLLIQMGKYIYHIRLRASLDAVTSPTNHPSSSALLVTITFRTNSNAENIPLTIGVGQNPHSSSYSSLASMQIFAASIAFHTHTLDRENAILKSELFADMGFVGHRVGEFDVVQRYEENGLIGY